MSLRESGPEERDLNPDAEGKLGKVSVIRPNVVNGTLVWISRRGYDAPDGIPVVEEVDHEVSSVQSEEIPQTESMGRVPRFVRMIAEKAIVFLTTQPQHYRDIP